MRFVGVVGVISIVMACGKVPTQASTPDAESVDAMVDAALATCAPTPPGLVARWRGDRNTKDDTGTYDGVPLGNLMYGPGRHGDAFVLNGTNAAVEISDNDKLWPAGSFSVEAWVNTTTNGWLIIKYQCGGQCPTGSSQAQWGLSIEGEHASFRSRANGNQEGAQAIDTTRKVTGAWHHLVGVRDLSAGEIQLYIDGKLAVRTPLTASQKGPMTNADNEVDPVVIGAVARAGLPGYESFYDAAIDEVAYFNQALTAAEIGAIYDAPEGECP